MLLGELSHVGADHDVLFGQLHGGLQVSLVAQAGFFGVLQNQLALDQLFADGITQFWRVFGALAHAFGDQQVS